MPLTRREQNTGAFITFWVISLFLLYLSFSIAGFRDEITFLVTIGVVLICAGSICLLVLRTYRKAQNPAMIDYLNIGVQRYLLALFMVMYGIDKLLGNFFDYQLFALDSKLNDISEFELAWFFYGKNRWQELFTGIMEFVPALFLLHRRTWYIAAIVLLPVTAQVFLLNLFFKIGGITFPAAMILLACNAYILYSQREKIILFFRSLNLNLAGKPLTGKTAKVIRVLRGIGLFLVVLVLFLKVKPVFFKSQQQRVYRGLVGAYTLKEMKRNGKPYSPAANSLYYHDLYIEKQSRWNILRRYNGSTDAFILQLHHPSDSMELYINKGGTGDDPDIIDTATVLKGVYHLDGKYLAIHGVQQQDTLQLVYERQDRLHAKKWFW